MDAFDYVIVGAGSAGCVLANRLSADPNVTVALIEAGGSDAHPYVHMPRGVGKLMAMPAYMYFYMTQPEPHNAMRPDVWLRGRVVGGSSSVNGMVWAHLGLVPSLLAWQIGVALFAARQATLAVPVSSNHKEHEQHKEYSQRGS